MPNVPNLPGVPPLSGYSSSGAIAVLAADAALIGSAFFPPTWGIYYQGQPVILPATAATQGAASALSPLTAVAGLLGLPNLLPVFASTVEFDFDQEWTVSDYQQEQGAFQSYDKVQMPFDVRVRMACGGDVGTRQAFINSVFAIAGAAPLGTSAAASFISSLTGGASLTSISSALTGGLLTGATAPPLFDIVTPEGTYPSCSAHRVSFGRRSDRGATMIIADISFVQVRQTSTSVFSSTLTPNAAGVSSLGVSQPQNANISFPSGSLL